MFGSNATRLARIDWSKYGRMELAGAPEPTNEQLKRAVEGLSVGIQQLAEELANMLGNYDIPTQHRAPLVSMNYLPDAPGVSPDEESLEAMYPQFGGVSGDSRYDPDSGLVHGGQVGFFRGVTIRQPALNNPNVEAGTGRTRLVEVGGAGAGISYENIYVDNLFKRDGTPWVTSLATLPPGVIVPWGKAIGDIPTGFVLCDGTANHTGLGGTGIDMRGQTAYGYKAGDPDLGTVGVSVAPYLEWSGDPVGSGGGTTPVSIGSSATGITVNTPTLTHSSENEFYTVPTTFCVFAVDDAPDLAVFDGTTAPDSNFLNDEEGGAGEITDQGHRHRFFVKDVTDLMADHAPAACTVTDTGHSHSGSTIDNEVLAANLTINTPSIVRPEGKVIAFIERLP